MWINAVKFSPDGKSLAAGGTEKAVRLWGDIDVNCGGHVGWINALAFSPSGSLLVSASDDSTVKLWHLPVGAMQGDLRGPFPVHSVAISPDASLLAAGDVKGVITLWNLTTKTPRGFLFDPEASAIDALVYQVVDRVTGRLVAYTLPFHALLPTGAECTCNCVPGKLEIPEQDEKQVRASSRSGEELEKIVAARTALHQQKKARKEAQLAAARAYMYYMYLMQQAAAARRFGGSSSCSCNTVCTCIPVSY
jgi:hypothetical protein